MKQFLPIILVVLCYACGNQMADEIPYTIIKGKIINTKLPKDQTNIVGVNFEAIEEQRKQIGLVTTYESKAERLSTWKRLDSIGFDLI